MSDLNNSARYFNVEKNSDEWDRCEYFLDQNARDESIVHNLYSVSKIHNEFIQNKFDSNIKNKTTKFLYHGTSKYDSWDLCHSFTGFDPKKSNVGYYGKGCYFATNPSYSLLFSNTVSGNTRYPDLNGCKQIIVAEVITGNTKDYGTEKNTKLTKPPYPGFFEKKYDSVKAGPHKAFSKDDNTIVEETEMYVVYKKYQAIPVYVLSFKENAGNIPYWVRTENKRLDKIAEAERETEEAAKRKVEEDAKRKVEEDAAEREERELKRKKYEYEVSLMKELEKRESEAREREAHEREREREAKKALKDFADMNNRSNLKAEEKLRKKNEYIKKDRKNAQNAIYKAMKLNKKLQNKK